MENAQKPNDQILGKLSCLASALEDIEKWVRSGHGDRAAREAASVRTILATVLARRRLTPENLEDFLRDPPGPREPAPPRPAALPGGRPAR